MSKKYIEVTATWHIPIGYGGTERWWEKEDTKIWDRLLKDKGYCTSIKVKEKTTENKSLFNLFNQIW